MSVTVEHSTIDSGEISRFSALAAEWWDAKGPMRPLHAMNPVRVGYIKGRLVDDLSQDADQDTHRRPFAGLTIADIGCGGGILSEPLCRLGARVTGVDASEENIGIAKQHAEDAGCEIDYRCAAIEDLAQEGFQCDILTALEIVEHVANLQTFLNACVEVVRPGGDLFFSTLNRTALSYAVAIVGAERIARIIPDGTHDHGKFVKPSELRRGLRTAGAELIDIKGMSFDLRNMNWRLSNDKSINYIVHARRLN